MCRKNGRLLVVVIDDMRESAKVFWVLNILHFEYFRNYRFLYLYTRFFFKKKNVLISPFTTTHFVASGFLEKVDDGRIHDDDER
jgi:hypothetical protein